MNIAIYGFFVLKFMDMVNYSQDQISFQESDIKSDEIGERVLSDTNMLFYFVIQSVQPRSLMVP